MFVMDNETKLFNFLTKKRDRLYHRLNRYKPKVDNLKNLELSCHGYWALGYHEALIEELQEQIEDINDIINSLEPKKQCNNPR